MALNPNLSLQVKTLDTASPLLQYAQIKEHKEDRAMKKQAFDLEALSAREKLRLQSVAQGIAEAKAIKDSGGDLNAWAKQRKISLGQRIANGENVDTRETDEFLTMLEQDPEQASQFIDSSYQGLQSLGVLKAPTAQKAYSVPAGGKLVDGSGNVIATAPAAPEKAPVGYRNTADGNLEKIPGGPKDEVKLSATQQKELYDTVDVVTATRDAIGALESAESKLAGGVTGEEAKPYSGFGAKALTAANRIPIVGLAVDDERAAATTDYSNIINQQALSSLKATFGGNPTEGERDILLKLQALSTYDVTEQRKIIANAKIAAQKRLDANTKKAQAIETGDNSALYDKGNSPTTLKAGAVEGGYTFLGGDPAKPENWKKN